jgi:2-polyprenyl-6-methoxyphenol hydroxylase-like FAD-dependent oxidoreductase
VNPPSDISHLLDSKLAKLHMVGQTAIAIFNFHAKLPNTLTWVVSSKNTSAKTPLDALLQEESQDFEGKDDVIKILNNAKPEELTFVTELCIVPLDQGWGGKGRVTLIGDAAHAIRPASGLGGSLAFEDAALLTRQLIKSPKSNDVAKALRAFEGIRLPRCKAIQEDQTRKSESGYNSTDAERKKLEWTPQYNEWVFAGPDASPHPPTEMYMS